MTAGSEGGFFYQVFYNVIHMFSTAGGIDDQSSFLPRWSLAPFFGQWVDRFGRRATVMVIVRF